MASYNYEPLPKDTFRLLTIVDRSGPVIECTLSTLSLDNPPAYSALSYTWGSAVPGDGLTPDRDHIVVCDGGAVPITASLGHALRSVPLSHGCVWADAVCINQHDLAERSAQVALMGRIYSQASQAVVWLGLADEYTQTAFDFIHDLAGRLPDEVLRSNWAELNQFFEGGGFWAKMGRPEWSVAEKHALVWLFMRNWFNRTWVIQEVVLASDAVVICGSYSAPWWVLSVVSALATQQNITRIAIEEVEEARKSLKIHDGFIRTIGLVPSDIAYLKERCNAAIASISDENRDYESAILLDIIVWIIRDTQASDPKDKTFAPMALLLHVLPSVRLAARLQPDYFKPVAQVFTEVSSYLLQHGDKQRRTFMLSMVGDKTQSQVEGLPSWVPDYSTTFGQNIALQFDRKFECIVGLDLDSYLEFTPRVSKLGLWASRFSTVSVLLPPLFKEGQSSVAGLPPWLQFAAALPDFDASGQPAILSMIHSFTANYTQKYDSVTAYDKFRRMITRHFCRLLIGVSVDALLSPGSILSGLLDDLERRRITAFPTCAQHRDALQDPKVAMEPEDEAFRFMRQFRQRLFQSSQGYLGIVPTTAETGDEIFFVPSSTVPFVFRKTNQSGEYKLVGEAYVHGIMHGELWRDGRKPEWSSVSLV